MNLLSQKAACVWRQLRVIGTAFGVKNNERLDPQRQETKPRPPTGARYENAQKPHFCFLFFPSRATALCYKNRENRLIVIKKQ